MRKASRYDEGLPRQHISGLFEALVDRQHSQQVLNKPFVVLVMKEICISFCHNVADAFNTDEFFLRQPRDVLPFVLTGTADHTRVGDAYIRDSQRVQQPVRRRMGRLLRGGKQVFE